MHASNNWPATFPNTHRGLCSVCFCSYFVHKKGPFFVQVQMSQDLQAVEKMTRHQVIKFIIESSYFFSTGRESPFHSGTFNGEGRAYWEQLGLQCIHVHATCTQWTAKHNCSLCEMLGSFINYLCEIFGCTNLLQQLSEDRLTMHVFFLLQP